MKRKILWLGLSWLMVAALMLASCGPAVPGEQEEEEEEEAPPVGEEEEEAPPVGEEEEEEAVVPAVGEPQYGGTVMYGYWGGEAPSADSTDGLWPTTQYTGFVLEFLRVGDFEKFGPRGTNEFGFGVENYVPEEFNKGGLAESWDVATDRIVFHIRHGVYWAAYGKEHVMESRELTAEDVAFSLNRFFDSAAGGNGINRTEKGGFIDSVYAEGDTVVVETSRFDANWYVTIAGGWGNAIYAPEVVEAGSGDWENLVGTGPFMWDKYVVGSSMTYIKNPNYWGTATINGKVYDDIPFIDRVIVPIIPDQATKLAALQTGVLDASNSIVLAWKPTLENTCPELNYKRWGGNISTWISLRCDQPPFDKKEVRQAMMIAIDRPAIREALYDGQGEIYGFPISPNVPAVFTPLDELPAETRLLYDYNPDLAKQMLADAGYPNGFGGVVIASEAMYPGTTDNCTMVQSYLAAIGVEAEVVPTENVTREAQVAAKEHDCVYSNSSVAYPPEALSKIYVPAGSSWKYTLWNNEYYQERYREAMQTVDVAERNAIFKELAVIALDSCVVIPMVAWVTYSAWWPWVKNYYGESWPVPWSVAPVMAALWIDQDLKAEMGF